MTDHHIHIGQFNEVYYDALELFELLESVSEKTNITQIRYSSTSTCRDDVELQGVEEEIAYAQSFSSNILTTKPYLWFIPKYAEQHISVESAATSFDYCGIKLHPAGQNWDENNPVHLTALHQIFRYADDHKKSVLIHCGTQKCDLPTRFEPFFAEYKNAQVILAHSNPVRETAEMVNKYKNVFCDTACITADNFTQLSQSVLDTRKILFGSDFPVSHYFQTHIFEKHLSLKEQYIFDCKKIEIPLETIFKV